MRETSLTIKIASLFESPGQEIVIHRRDQMRSPASFEIFVAQAIQTGQLEMYESLPSGHSMGHLGTWEREQLVRDKSVQEWAAEIRAQAVKFFEPEQPQD